MRHGGLSFVLKESFLRLKEKAWLGFVVWEDKVDLHSVSVLNTPGTCALSMSYSDVWQRSVVSHHGSRKQRHWHLLSYWNSSLMCSQLATRTLTELHSINFLYSSDLSPTEAYFVLSACLSLPPSLGSSLASCFFAVPIGPAVSGSRWALT